MDNENLCDGCLYAELDGNKPPCSSCIHWVNGYLDAANFVPKEPRTPERTREAFEYFFNKIKEKTNE